MERKIVARELVIGNFEEVTVDEWLKKEGELVQEGEVIAQLLTDKVVIELASPVSGKLVKIVCQDGETAAPEDTLAVIETEQG